MLYNSAMLGVPFIIQQREQRRKANHQHPARRAGFGCSILLSLVLAVMVITLSLGYTFLIQDLPSLEAIPALLEPPNGKLLQPTRLYDRTGRHLLLELENPSAAGREYLYVPSGFNNWQAAGKMNEQPLPFTASAPHPLIAATLAIQDPTFWEHPGFLLQGLLQGEQPTLAQRLAVELLLDNEAPGLARNLRERLLAAQLTNHYGRARIIEWYLNSAAYGPLIYGADAAARVYFDKPAANLSLSEAAILAAVVESPSLNPFSAPDIVLERQQQVLTLMLTKGFISREEMQEALINQINFRPQPQTVQNPAPAFTRLLLDQLGQRFGIPWIERGGLTIITTLDYDLQMQINCTAQAELERLRNGLSVRPSLTSDECRAARLLPTMPFSGDLSQLDLVSNAIVLDPQSGQILALSGGISPGLDPTRLPGHSPGTLFTPFIYLTAFTRGFSPASLVWDIPSLSSEYPQSQAQSNLTYHGPVRLRTAFANDYLAPAWQIMTQIGPENVWRTAQQMGLASLTQASVNNLTYEPSPLNGGETTLLEMAQAYGVLANQGVMAGLASPALGPVTQALGPVTVLSIKDTAGYNWLGCQEALIQCPLQARPVVSPQLAYLTTQVLSDETARWTSMGHPNPLEVGRPAAAKIGRTGGSSGTWTIGYTPQLVAGVWVGPEARSLETVSLSAQEDLAITNAAAALWHAILQYASRDLPPQAWTIPGGISKVEVCEPSGLLPTAFCPVVVTEYFLEGNEPIYGDNLYRAFSVNRETGRLATVFTPPGLVEERVYLVPPPFAIDWTAQADLPIPPSDYDSIYAPPPASGNAQIHVPEMFTHIGGKVSIRGSAGGDNFSFYRLQVGKGLNPREWIQIGEDSPKPVLNGLLGQWDTEGLSGLYALRLMVVGEDQRVETAVVQITLDNENPGIEIIQPQPGRQVELTETNSVVLQVQATDDTSLAAVDFYIDGEFWVSMADAPYITAWGSGKPGKHSLRVIARDLAGNIQEVESEFIIVGK